MTIAVINIAIITLLINVPLGYWRGGVRKFSVKWFIAVHAAVPVVISMRIMTGIEWRVTTVAFLIFCYFLGQLVGTRLRRRFNPSDHKELTVE